MPWPTAVAVDARYSMRRPVAGWHLAQVTRDPQAERESREIQEGAAMIPKTEEHFF